MGALEADEHQDALRRSLAWDGCFNVRDLGGLETASGGRTRRGMVVRADNVRRLTAAGWQAALILREGNAPLDVGPQPDYIGKDLDAIVDQLIERYAAASKAS